MDEHLDQLIWQDNDRMSGAPCLYGTRIRVQDLFDWMAGGGDIDGFVRTYPHVSRNLIVAILHAVEGDLIKDLQAV